MYQGFLALLADLASQVGRKVDLSTFKVTKQ